MLILSRIAHPGHSIAGLIRKMWRLFPNDALYLKLIFFFEIGEILDLSNPKTYNQKLQWLKLYNRKPEYTKMVDKITAKEYVAEKIGKEYIIPTLGVWTHFKDIDFSHLPKEFVLKTNHGSGSGGVIICRDKNNFDRVRANKVLEGGLRRNCYNKYREWPYKNVAPKIFAERLLQEEDGDLRDYKVMCFNGVVKLIEFHQGRFSCHHTQDFYDRDWNLTKITQGSYGGFNTTPSPKPPLFDEMIRLSEVLAKDIPHVRVDWYIVNNHLYFGELTFFDGSGFEPWDRYEDDLLMGSWITLPKKSIK